MQNIIDNQNIHQNNVDCDRRFSNIVIEYQEQVESVIAWLYKKEEELQSRPSETTLAEDTFGKVLDEYSRHEKFISEVCEYCHTIMKCKEDGQEMRENSDVLTEEDLDEIGIQMDAMMVCYEKLKILATDRLRCLQRIIEERQHTQIGRFEEWLSTIEMKISSLNNIGPDFASISRQLREMADLELELWQKQDFLNFMSTVIIFDEVDPESLQLRSRSCESLDERLGGMNRRWTEICHFVDDRNKKISMACEIWNFITSDGNAILQWLNNVEKNLQEISEATKNLSTDSQADKKFITKLLTRSDKIESDIKSKQSSYTRFENRLRNDIDKFDDPCSMLIIEWERKLEDMQARWNTVMNRKRMLDYTLQALVNPESADHVNYNMIPLPDPITSIMNNESRLANSLSADSSTKHNDSKQTFDESFNTSSSSGNDVKDLNVKMNGSYSDSKVFDDSLTSDTKSLIYGDNFIGEQRVNNIMNGSQDDLSSASMTASFPINVTSLLQDGTSYNFPKISMNDHSSDMLTNHNIPDSQRDYCSGHQADGAHSCRVEEWKHSLESFSNWLKRVETSLGIDNSLDSIVGPDSSRQNQTWFRLDLHKRLLLLNEIEGQIVATCQDEFDCLILQGQQIIEDLIPEIGENEYEANLKDILSDIEIRYGAVKRCLLQRKQELADKDRWLQLLKTLRESSDYLIEKMAQVMPETNIGVDLISLAQQQDELMHAKADLDDNVTIQSSIQEAKLFLKVCDTLQQQTSQSSTTVPTNCMQQQQAFNTDSTTKLSNNDIWLSFKELREDIESQLDRLTLHYSELSQLIDDRLARLDEVHKEMHALQHRMQDLAAQLQVAEILRSNWTTLDDLTVEQLSEQLEDLKLYRERLTEIESIHKMMNSIFDWMTQSDVPLSQQNLKRIDELNTIWDMILMSVEERQKLIEQAFDNQGASEQKFLNQTVADLPRWERRVATSRVPYFVDLETNKTEWDHPKFNDLLESMSSTKQIIFAAYRTALKLRLIQKKIGIDLLMLEQFKDVLNCSNSSQQNQTTNNNNTSNHPVVRPSVGSNNNDTLIGVEQIIFLLKAIYERVQSEEKPTLDVPLSIDLTLNWLLNLYDSTRTGYISVLSLKVGLALICCATREEKYTYMYELVANHRTGGIDPRKLGTLFETCMRIPVYLGEGDSFGGSEIIETSIRNCFSMSKFNPQNQNCIDMTDYLNWLKSEPQFIIWLPVLHRLLISEQTHHPIKCKLCGANPIIGLRYRCLKCFKFNICQNCFLVGRHLFEHYDPAKHQLREYCSLTSSGENVLDFTKILRNKIKPKPLYRKSSEAPK